MCRGLLACASGGGCVPLLLSALLSLLARFRGGATLVYPTLAPSGVLVRAVGGRCDRQPGGWGSREPEHSFARNCFGLAQPIWLTIRHLFIHAVLRNALQTAVREEVIPRNVAKLVKVTTPKYKVNRGPGSFGWSE
jgi:hypothetical protein